MELTTKTLLQPTKKVLARQLLITQQAVLCQEIEKQTLKREIADLRLENAKLQMRLRFPERASVE